MAGILTPSSTAGEPQAPPAIPTKAIPPAPPLGTPQQTTLSMNNPLANATGIQSPTAPPLHSDEAVNMALMQAFHPIVPDQINSLLGPAIGHIQGGVLPMAFYQPRPAPQVSIRKSS